MGNTAVIIGATGVVGRVIVNEILSGEYYDRIYILGRSSITKLPDDSRLEKIIIDFENIDFDMNILENADVFSSLGTTIKIAGSKENQRKIDVDYTVNFAKLCEGKIRSFNVVSAMGASSKSKNFYTSFKGELEDKLKELGHKHFELLHGKEYFKSNSFEASEIFIKDVHETLSKMTVQEILKMRDESRIKAFANNNNRNTKETIKILTKLRNGE